MGLPSASAAEPRHMQPRTVLGGLDDASGFIHPRHAPVPHAPLAPGSISAAPQGLASYRTGVTGPVYAVSLYNHDLSQHD